MPSQPLANLPAPPAAPLPGGLSARPTLIKASWTLLLFLIGLVTWAAFAPLDEGVPTRGVVSIDTKRRAVQHREGGWIQHVYVKEGQEVGAGDVLVTLESPATRASLETLRQQLWATMAAQSRLQAEQNQLPAVQFRTESTQAQKKTDAHSYMAIQSALFDSRRASFRANMRAFDESLRGAKEQSQELQSSIQERQRQNDVLDDQIQRLGPVVDAGYAPRNQLLDLKRQYLESRAQMDDARANLVKLNAQQLELQHRRQAYREDFFSQVAQQLGEAQRDIRTYEEKIAAAQQDFAKLTITAPVSGQVIGLTVQAKGAVVAPGQTLMEIVPKERHLIFEARLSPHLIDRVHVGQPTDVRFSAFVHSPMLVVQGHVQTISEDVLTDRDSHQSFYLIRVEVSDQGMRELNGREVQAGMAADLMIKTGERTMLTYLAYPLIRRFAKVMTEE